MKIVIMTTCYNAEKYIARCIESVKKQNFTNYKMVITDDVSTDNSVSVIKNAILDDDRFLLIENNDKRYAPGNHYQISKLSFVESEDILICLDGDDYFYDEYVLDRVFGYYYKTKYLMSFGQFIHFDGNCYWQGFTKKPNSWNVRNESWTTSHLKTFKAKVFWEVLEEDLKSPSGNYWESAGDLAIIFPMLEMVGEDKVLFVDDLNLVYNCENVLNDYKVNGGLQQHYDMIIRNKKRYFEKDFFV